MPLCHRHTDRRACSAKTKVIGQSTVFVNNLLWAVEGDIDDHCDEGQLVASYGSKSVYLNNKLAICTGDTALADRQGCFIPHPPGATRPAQGSPNTYMYGGSIGGGIVA